MKLSTGGWSGLSLESTLGEAGEAWLLHMKTRATTGGLAWSTYESYETTLRLILLPRCAAIPLDALTVGRCDRIIQRLLMDETLSKARRARSVLSLICGYAVRDDAMARNPVRDVQRLPMREKKRSVLTPDQITAIRELMRRWRETGRSGPRPDHRALIDGMDIMLGSSARVGECLGLRRKDVDMTTAPPTLLVDGTIVQSQKEGLHRKNAPKRTRQRRRIALPVFAASAVRRRLALAAPGPEAFLFPTSTGRPMSVSNYERLLRSFVDDSRRWVSVPARTVAAGDGARSLSTPLTRCYAEAGTPPGRWLGSGVRDLGGCLIREGDRVSEAQLQLLVGMGRDPVTGVPLGRAYPACETVEDRIAKRAEDLTARLWRLDRAAAVAAIERLSC